MPFTAYQGPDFAFESLTRDGGSLDDQLAAWASKAAALGRVACVYLRASWCPANGKLERALDDARMQHAMRQVHVATFDIDVWSDDLTKAGMASHTVPVFYILDADGRATGAKIHGGAWREDLPENMAPPLERFFDGPRAELGEAPASSSSRAAVAIAYDSTGRNLVLCDGAELLVHDGPSEGPRWRRTGHADIVAVGATPDAVISVDRRGDATWSDPEEDRVIASTGAGESIRHAAVSPEGHVLVAISSGALELTPAGVERRLAWPDAIVVACGPEGRALVVDAAGKLGEFIGGGQRGQAQLDAPPVAAAWNPRGFWVIATASKLVRFEDGALHHLTNAPGDMPVRAVACSHTGAAIALVLGDNLVIVLSWPQRDSIGQLRYLDRSAAGVAFGPAPWLAVALDRGDGNKFNLATGDLNRTDTQPGREHRRWMVQVSVSPPEQQPAAAAPPRAAAPPTANAADAPQTASVGTIIIVLVVTLAVIGLIALVAL